MTQEASVNSDARSAMAIIEGRVARTQVKYHRWAKTDRMARFGDLFNLVCHPVHLLVAWDHVAHNKGARTAGIDGVTVRQISQAGQVGAFLAGIASALKDGTYRPSPVRRVLIPKPGGKSRPLGIPTVTDRVVHQLQRRLDDPVGNGGNAEFPQLPRPARFRNLAFPHRQRPERARLELGTQVV